jgi:nucleotide-binding universal stress UspA family protein
MSAGDASPNVEPREDAFRDVFVPQDESEASLAALAYADGLCSEYGARLTGLMVGLVPYYPMMLSASTTPQGWMHAQKQANEEASLSEQRLRAIYATLTSAQHDLKRVDAFEQEAARITARRARTADLTVMGWSSGGGGDLERAVFEACLFESGRPVLLTPPGSKFRGSPQRVLVAWNGSREATRAVREALPLLRRARLTRLVVVDAEDPDGAVEDASAPLARHLGRHGVAVETKHAHSGSRNVALTLADEADQFGAGILVLGGFGYIRAGQWLYGGTTRSALDFARTPLFFAN